MVKISRDILARLKAVSAKRPKTVIVHLLKHGSITTQELTELYGYEHPPRAIRDVRELGIPLVTCRTRNAEGKTIASYRFGDLTRWQGIPGKKAGRTVLAKTIKKSLLEIFGARCSIYLEPMDAESLQVDHRIPYEIGGESPVDDLGNFMLLCPSANRAKSWTCEHCENWTKKDPLFCLRCFWAHPEDYDHVAGKPQKIVTIVFTGDEVKDYNRLVELSGAESAQSVIKQALREKLNKSVNNDAKR